MSELNDLLTTRELQRWRLILGEAAETTLCGLDDNARQIDHALEWLYGRDPERLQRGDLPARGRRQRAQDHRPTGESRRSQRGRAGFEETGCPTQFRIRRIRETRS